MEINKQTLKALSSDSRLAIMKSLTERRKMSAELQRQLNLSGSTIVGHLGILEQSGLVKRIETGHKWIYYDLTKKGLDLVKPSFPVQFVLMLTLGVVLVFGGFVKYSINTFAPLQMEAAPKLAVGGESAIESVSATVDWVMIAAMVIGIILLLIGLVGLMKGRLKWLK